MMRIHPDYGERSAGAEQTPRLRDERIEALEVMSRVDTEDQVDGSGAKRQKLGGCTN
jgi:hypothetical protein